MAPVGSLGELSFFELDKLFSESARSIKRKIQRKRRKNKKLNVEEAIEVIKSPSRSRSPPQKRLRFAKVPIFGGFTGNVDNINKAIVVSGVPASVDERAVWLHFSRCGIVSDVKMLINRREVRTGVAIVEFNEDEAVARACMLGPGQNELFGLPLQVKRADAQLAKGQPAPKKMMTRSQFTQQVLSGLKTEGGPKTPADAPSMRKLHIKNLRPVVTEDDMRGIFKPFGEFEDFKMGSQECWITFQNHNDAQDAMGSMQGFQLVGQELQITMQSIEVTPVPALPAPPKPETLGEQMAKDTDFGSGNADATGRVELMKKLMESQGIPAVAGSGANLPPPPPPASGVPVPPPPPSASGAEALPPTPKPGGPTARTMLLQNMFSPTNVNLSKDPRFYEEIREDTHEECSKFGKVLHVTVDPRGNTGLIYVLYESPAQRQAAELALNGRWFEGKKILAAGIDDSIWQALAAQAQGPK